MSTLGRFDFSLCFVNPNPTLKCIFFEKTAFSIHGACYDLPIFSFFCSYYALPHYILPNVRLMKQENSKHPTAHDDTETDLLYICQLHEKNEKWQCKQPTKFRGKSCWIYLLFNKRCFICNFRAQCSFIVQNKWMV